MRQSDLCSLERCDGGVALKQEMLHDSYFGKFNDFVDNLHKVPCLFSKLLKKRG